MNDILSYKIFVYQKFEVTLLSILISLVIYFVTKVAIKVTKRVFFSEIKYISGISRKQATFTLVKYFIWIIAGSLILGEFGLDLKYILGGATALLIGFGLGVQQIFNDMTSGFLLLFEGKVEVNDIVEVEGLIGRVNKISIRTSEISTRDDIIIVVPNSKLISENVINWSHNNQKTRFHVAVGVSYDSDVNLVKDILLASTRNFNEIASNPRPFVRFAQFGDSALEFELYFWTDEVFRIETLTSRLRFRIIEQFRANHIKIPYPQRELHIVNKDGRI